MPSSLCVWDVEAGTVQWEEVEDPGMTTAAFDARCELAVIGSRLGTLRVWDLTRGTTIRELQSRERGILDVVMLADGRTAVAADRSDTLNSWDLQTGHRRASLAGKAGAVDAVSIAPNGEIAYSVYGDTVVAAHVQRGAVLGSLSVDHQITAMAVVPDGRHLALGDESGRVHLMRLEA
jgi:WD40 repeat protein